MKYNAVASSCRYAQTMKKIPNPHLKILLSHTAIFVVSIVANGFAILVEIILALKHWPEPRRFVAKEFFLA